jgi:hypothetical protein
MFNCGNHHTITCCSDTSSGQVGYLDEAPLTSADIARNARKALRLLPREAQLKRANEPHLLEQESLNGLLREFSRQVFAFHQREQV